MKKKPGKYLKFYEQHVANSSKCAYLCTHFDGDTLFKLFIPTYEEWELLNGDGEQGSVCCWGSFHSDNYLGEFNTFRQTVVLLMAAMNNEL